MSRNHFHLKWLIKLFDASSNLLLRALRIEPVHDVEHSATPRDLEHIVAESRETGDLPRELSTLLDRILDFPTRTAEHAMIPRARVDTVAADARVEAVLAKMAAGHTRYPVTGTSPDDLLGVVHLHDLLDATPTDIAGALCRSAVMVPTTLPLTAVLAQLTKANEEMALVIDEYGGFSGVVTIEDMAEQLVGEIADEHDPDRDDAGIARHADGWLSRGFVHLDEIARTLGHGIPQGDYETLAGLIIAKFGGLPAVGDEVEIPLDPDPAELAHGDKPPNRILLPEVRAVEHHVPDSLFVTVRADAGGIDDE